eukprot:XP_014012577.1 PREDICTED: B-cell receptor CD22-like isoform X4 [Salmo salar]
MHCQYILQISLLTLISLQVLSLKLNENGPVKKRDNVILACTSTCKLPQMEFLWFKDGRPLSGVPGGQYPLGPLSPNDTGCYSCALGQGISTPILLDVRYAPRDVSVKVSPSPEVVNGSRLTMTCSNNANPAAQTYIWFQSVFSESAHLMMVLAAFWALFLVTAVIVVLNIYIKRIGTGLRRSFRPNKSPRYKNQHCLHQRTSMKT